jgi:hypothetical protein
MNAEADTMTPDDADDHDVAAAYHRDMAETARVANAIYEGHYTLDFDHPLSKAEADEFLGKPGEITINPMVMHSLRVPNEIVVGARKLAADRGIKVSTLFREWLAAGYEAATASSTPVVEMRLVRDYLDELIRREHAA